MERILITPLFGMGDTLMTTPALEVLKQKRPDTHITYFTFNKTTHAVMLNNPHIDNLIYYPIKAIHFYKDIFYILNTLTAKFDTCINFYPSNRSAYNLFSAFTLAKKRIGNTYLHLNFSQLNWIKNYTIAECPEMHCVEKNVELLRFLGVDVMDVEIPTTKIYPSEGDEIRAQEIFSLQNGAITVGVHAGTSTFKGHTNRRWPTEKFIELINLHSEKRFLLFGTLDEIAVNERIKSSVKNPDNVVIVRDISIPTAAALIGKLNAFVTNDSGLMHVANAVQTPIVAILGPTNPNYIKPWKVKSEVVRNELPCSPCFYYSPRPLRCSLDGKFSCLTGLEVDKVSAALKSVLSKCETILDSGL